MKNFIAVLFLIPFVLKGQVQSDTIFKKDGGMIVCQITEIKKDLIFFNHNKLKGRFIDKEIVSAYSVNGRREVPAIVTDPKDLGSRELLSKKDTIDISQELDFMKLCLRKCHREYVTGLICLGGGVVLNALGGALVSDSPDAAKAFFVLGSAAAITGLVLMIDSHKWINRAGLGLYGLGNEAGVYYRFK